MYLSNQHQRLAKPIFDIIKDLEHYRSTVDLWTILDNGREYYHWDRPKHTAVIVLKDGSCYVGEAVCSEVDSYNRKTGYNIAVGRALKSVVSGNKPDFTVDQGLGGLDLRDRCRECLNMLVKVDS